MKRLLKAALVAVALTVPLTYSAPSHAVIVETLAAGVVIDQLSASLRSALEQAKAVGNLFMAKMLQNGLDLLDAWKKTNTDLINTAFDRLDASMQDGFRKIDALAAEAAQLRTETVQDVERLSGEWAQIVSTLPLAKGAAFILDYGPRVLLSKGTDDIPMRVVGPNLSQASAVLTLPSGEKVSISAAAAQELDAILKRSSFTFSPTEASYAKLRVTYNAADVTGFFGFWGQWFPNTQTSELPIWLLPETLGHYSLTTRVTQHNVETSEYVVSTGGRGQDAPYEVGIVVRQDLRDAGWRVDIEHFGERFSADNRGGDNGTCSGVRMPSLSPNGFTFFMDLGHVRKGFPPHNSDAFVNCDVHVPLIRTVDTEVDGPSSEGTITWDEATLPLPPELTSLQMKVDYFDKSHFELQGDRTLPFLDVRKDQAGLHLQPNAPRFF